MGREKNIKGSNPIPESSTDEVSEEGEKSIEYDEVQESPIWERNLEELKAHEYKDKLIFINRNFAQGSFGTISLAHGPEESMKLAVKQYNKKWDEMEPNEKQGFVHEIR